MKYHIITGTAKPIRDMDAGTVFVLYGDVWMKIDPITHGAEELNAVRLSDGLTMEFLDDELAIPREISYMTLK